MSIYYNRMEKNVHGFSSKTHTTHTYIQFKKVMYVIKETTSYYKHHHNKARKERAVKTKKIHKRQQKL